jgi:DNA polymerase III delta prime subunit
MIKKVWADFYRPKTVTECILTDELTNKFNSYLREENIPNLILSGGPGVGKTSVAMAMLDDFGCDWIKINASLKGIDVIRDEVAHFASTVSFAGKKKYVIFEEADGFSLAAQDALRAFIEEFTDNCGYIFTCNNSDKIIPAIQSRCIIIHFDVKTKDFPLLAKKFYDRIQVILTENHVTFEKQAIGPVMKKFFPDWRKVLIVLQEYALENNNVIDTGILSNKDTDSLAELVGFLKKKQWNEMRRWVGENNNAYVDFSFFVKKLQKELEPLVEVNCYPILALRVNEFDYQNYFVTDKELNVVAMLTRLMPDLVFKG